MAERIKGLRNSAKKTVTACQESFSPMSETDGKPCTRTVSLVHSLVESGLSFFQRYPQANKRKLLIDFGDSGIFAYMLFWRSSTPDHIIPFYGGYELQKRIDEVVDDEISG